MSKWDRVNIAALGPCCVAAVHGRAELAREGAVIACAGCGLPITCRGGIWTRGPAC